MQQSTYNVWRERQLQILVHNIPGEQSQHWPAVTGYYLDRNYFRLGVENSAGHDLERFAVDMDILHPLVDSDSAVLSQSLMECLPV